MSGGARIETPVALVERVFEVLKEGGPPELLARWEGFFSQGFEWRPALMATVEGERTYVGRSGFAEFWDDFNGVFADAEWEPVSFQEPAPGIVLVGARLRGRGATSGVPVEEDVAFVLEVSDGRIASGRTFFSTAEARESIGA